MHNAWHIVGSPRCETAPFSQALLPPTGQTEPKPRACRSPGDVATADNPGHTAVWRMTSKGRHEYLAHPWSLASRSSAAVSQ